MFKLLPSRVGIGSGNLMSVEGGGGFDVWVRPLSFLWGEQQSNVLYFEVLDP